MAYEASDFTIVYPVARALPVLLVALGDVFRGRFLNGPGWLGLVLVAVGCLLTPLHSFGEISLRRYFHRSIFWMLLAAIGTVGYSLLDKVASEVVLAGPATAARYCYIFFFFASVVLLLLRRLTNNKPPKDQTIGWKSPAGSSVLYSVWLRHF
jgi:drug/metabolite transporter (DMT)-like permease